MRRPTAFDRQIANYLCSLPDGSHKIAVESGVNDFARGGRYLGLPALKPEGGLSIDAEGKRITVIPERVP